MAGLGSWWTGLGRRLKRLRRPDIPDAADAPALLPPPAAPLPQKLAEAVEPSPDLSPLALPAAEPRLALPSPAPFAVPAPLTARRRRISLALQGGGAHGAFTWGVLDRLLEDDGLEIVAVSGASAGAMNGAMLLQGLGQGGPAGARRQLDAFWERISASGALGPIRPTALDRLTGNWNLDGSPATHWYEQLRRWVTPYDLHPADFHPLRPLLRELLDVAALRAAGVDLYVSATDVGRGDLRIFTTDEIGVDHLLASACLPHMFQAVRIDGADYWDGGYLANPALFPLLERHPDAELTLVSITPFTCPDLPRSPGAINARLGEIAFNAPLIREIQDLRRRQAQGAAPVRLHHIQAEEAMRGLGHYSKLSADRAFLHWLKETGRAAATKWLNSEAEPLKGQAGPLTANAEGAALQPA